MSLLLLFLKENLEQSVYTVHECPWRYFVYKVPQTVNFFCLQVVGVWKRWKRCVWIFEVARNNKKGMVKPSKTKHTCGWTLWSCISLTLWLFTEVLKSMFVLCFSAERSRKTVGRNREEKIGECVFRKKRCYKQIVVQFWFHLTQKIVIVFVFLVCVVVCLNLLCYLCLCIWIYFRKENWAMKRRFLHDSLW